MRCWPGSDNINLTADSCKILICTSCFFDNVIPKGIAICRLKIQICQTPSKVARFCSEPRKACIIISEDF